MKVTRDRLSVPRAPHILWSRYVEKAVLKEKIKRRRSKGTRRKFFLTRIRPSQANFPIQARKAIPPKPTIKICLLSSRMLGTVGRKNKGVRKASKYTIPTIIQSITIGIRVSFLADDSEACDAGSIFGSGLETEKPVSVFLGAIVPSLLRSIFIFVSLLIVIIIFLRHNNTPLLPWVKKKVSIWLCFYPSPIPVIPFDLSITESEATFVFRR